MTVRELRDKLDHYIKTDPLDQCQCNDIQLDAEAYKERCKERENHRVVIADDGMTPKYFDIDSQIGLTIDIETKPAVIEMKDMEVEEQEPLIGGFYIDSNGKLVSNGPGYITVKKIKNVPVQVEPPQYKQEKAVGLICDLTNDITFA